VEVWKWGRVGDVETLDLPFLNVNIEKNTKSLSLTQQEAARARSFLNLGGALKK
jgi:hypothetical protein